MVKRMSSIHDHEAQENQKSLTRQGNAKSGTSPSSIEMSFPFLSADAFYGLAGHVVRKIYPHTEAHPAALLFQFLVAFGNLVGKSSFFRVGEDLHYTKLNVLLVGETSKGRKGTSLSYIRELLGRTDNSFNNCIVDGVSTGEGIIFYVRDEVRKNVAIKEKGKIKGYEEEIVDRGAEEKRLMIMEPEFARLLRVMSREHSTLSSIIRQSYDTDQLRVMTVKSYKATNTHISIIGHITAPELKKNLSEIDMANGFANRFLFAMTKRMKMMPEPSNLDQRDRNDLVYLLQKSVRHARTVGEVERDESARNLWREVYPRLSEGWLGLVGAVSSRAEAQVMRIALIYALLDRSNYITSSHLTAALAAWKYSVDSVRYIFKSMTGDKIADRIYLGILSNPDGLSRTAIRDIFDRNLNSSTVSTALNILVASGLATVSIEETNGRPREVYRGLNDGNWPGNSANAFITSNEKSNMLSTDLEQLSRLERC
jgi:hypothetical protein